MESIESFDSAPRIKESPDDTPIVENDGHSIRGTPHELTLESECEADEKLNANITEPLDLRTNVASTGAEKVEKKANASSELGKKKDERRRKVDPRQPCQVCGKLIRMCNLQKHTNAHTTAGVCGFCEQKFESRYKLKKHLVAVHNSVHYTCDICNKKCILKSEVRAHIKRKHNFGAKYECKLCQKVYKEPTSLSKHVKSSHEGIRHECHECQKTFTRKPNLTKHIKLKHIN
ncbi:zinc finger protein 596-like [Trichogramma pretiosum]|uniref:zinc finger protein 596-like n=1 Tax=Trichogramma pretiosum TaxID=7493 RepID=UPI0006C94138|nr:zinc finger protein 596-like [Trichogramma pretiosum]